MICTDKREWLVQFYETIQVTEDQWDRVARSLKVTKDTPIRELIDWQQLHNGSNKSDLKIMLLDNVKPKQGNGHTGK
jgi:hypothetical protein